MDVLTIQLAAEEAERRMERDGELARLGLTQTFTALQTFDGGIAAKTSPAATITVAAQDAPIELKRLAHYVCDGEADEDELNAAVADFDEYGGDLKLLGRDFVVDVAPWIIDRDNVIVRGAGGGLPSGSSGVTPAVPGGPTRIRAGEGFTEDYLIRCERQDADVQRCVYGVELHALGILGTNYTGGAVTNVGGIYWQVIRGGMSWVFAQYLRGHGLYSTALRIAGLMPNGYPAGAQAPYDSIFSFCRFRNNGGDNMFFDDTSTDHQIDGCVLEAAGGAGLRAVGPTYKSTALQIKGCYVYSNLGTGLILPTWQTKVYNTRVQDNRQGGTYLSGDAGDGGGFQIVGGNYRNNSAGADNTYDAINITATGAIYGGTIAGVDFYADAGLDNGGSGASLYKQRYGINVVNSNMNDLSIGPCGYGRKSGPTATFGTGFINDQGTNTKIVTGDRMKLADGADIAVGTGTGTKIGTSSSQKLGFFGATPVVRPAATSDLRQALIDIGLLASGGATPLSLNGGMLSAAQVSVTKDDTAYAVLTGYGTSKYGTLQMRGARGTIASPLRVKGGDLIGRVEAYGTYAADDVSPGTFASGQRTNISLVASEDWTSTAQGAYLVFNSTNSTTTTVAERARVGQHGQGFDFISASLLNFAIRLANNAVALVGRNAANNANVNLLKINASDRLELQADTEFTDAKNLVVGTTTGTKIATATSQKLGFYGATPIARPTGVAVDAAGIHAALVSLGLIGA